MASPVLTALRTTVVGYRVRFIAQAQFRASNNLIPRIICFCVCDSLSFYYFTLNILLYLLVAECDSDRAKTALGVQENRATVLEFRSLAAVFGASVLARPGAGGGDNFYVGITWT